MKFFDRLLWLMGRPTRWKLDFTITDGEQLRVYPGDTIEVIVTGQKFVVEKSGTVWFMPKLVRPCGSAALTNVND